MRPIATATNACERTIGTSARRRTERRGGNERRNGIVAGARLGLPSRSCSWPERAAAAGAAGTGEGRIVLLVAQFSSISSVFGESGGSSSIRLRTRVWSDASLPCPVGAAGSGGGRTGWARDEGFLPP